MRPRADMLDGWQTLLGVGQAARWAEGLSPTDKVPFTLVTGFLGSGKTTLLSHLLANPGGRRIAVLVNDFGAINIDAALIRNRTAEVVELSNGCACCGLSAGLARGIADLLAGEPRPDALVLEASGVAEPAGILHVALSHPAIRLESVVAVADADLLEDQLADPNASAVLRRQARAADLVVLNKGDLAGAERVERARRLLEEITPARIIETDHARAPAEIILGGGAGPRDRGCWSEGHPVAFETWTLYPNRALDARRLCMLAEDLPRGILRAKGMVEITTYPGRPHLLQVVGRRWALEPEPAWPEDGRSAIVFIGRAGPEEIASLSARLDACAP